MKRIPVFLLMVCATLTCKAQINVHKYQKEGVTLEEIQQAIEYNLSQIKIWEAKHYLIPGPPLTEQNYFYKYFTEKAKERMIQLFEGQWTEEELQSELVSSLSDILDTLDTHNGYYKNAKKIARRDSLPLERVWDSMLTVRKNQYRESILENKSVPRQVISIAGYLKDPRFLPYLRKMGQGNNVDYEIALALARYGEEPYLTNAIERQYDQRNWRKLAYICRKEAVTKMYEYAMTEDGLSCDSHGMGCYQLLAEFAAGWLSILFNSEEMSKEMKELRREYMYPELRQPDEDYVKRFRTITEKYYQRFKDQEPDCENVSIYAW